MLAYRETFGTKTSAQHFPREHWVILLLWQHVRPWEANPEVCIRSYLADFSHSQFFPGIFPTSRGPTQEAKYRDPHLLECQTPMFQNSDFPLFNPQVQRQVEHLIFHRWTIIQRLTRWWSSPSWLPQHKAWRFPFLNDKGLFFFLTSLSLCCSCMNEERPWVTEMQRKKISISKYATWTMGKRIYISWLW